MKTLFTVLALAINLFATAQELKVQPGTALKIETATTLKLSGGGNLTLESDATGDASLIDLGSVIYTGDGEANVERYLTNSKWHLISAPVAGILAEQFPGDYLQIHNESSNSWTDVSSFTYELNAAKGYALWTVDEAPTTELFAGITHTGDQSFNFTQNSQGFNLVGNPYPSVLDWEKVTIPGALSGAIWLFDPMLGDNGDYRYYINGGDEANTTSQFIPSGQGFFVRATSGSGTLTFQNDDRTHGGQTFYKSGAENQMLVLKATGNNITTQTAIRFDAAATPQVDRLLDVTKIISNSTNVPNVYTKCNGEKMAINTLPSLADHETVPVYFEAGMDGTYSFTAAQLETISEDVPVILEDVLMNYVQDLRDNPVYSFGYATGAVKEFIIHFKDVTSIDETIAEAPVFHCLLSNGRLSVNYLGSSPFEGPATISVYNLAGQQMLTTEADNPQTDLSFSGSSAMYIIRIQYGQARFTTKIINQ